MIDIPHQGGKRPCFGGVFPHFLTSPPVSSVGMSRGRIMGSRTGLVMRIVHWRRPLALASPSREFALTRATLSRSLADLVLLLITKPV